MSWWFDLHDVKNSYKSPFAKAYEGIGTKLTLLEKHIESSENLYYKERNENLEELKRIELWAEQEVKKEYQRLIELGEESEVAWELAEFSQSGNNPEDIHEKEYEIMEYFSSLIDLYNKSFLVSLYGFLESEFKQLCEIACTVWAYRIKPEDLKDKNHIASYKKYFDLVVNLPPESIEILKTYIDFFQSYQLLRNKIVHEGGIIESIPDDLKKEKISYNSSTKQFSICDSEFLISFALKIGDFFDDLHIILEEKEDFKFLKDSLISFFESCGYDEVGVKKIDYTRKSNSSKAKGQLIIYLRLKRNNSNAINLKFIIERNSKIQEDERFIIVYNATNNGELIYFDEVIQHSKYFWFKFIQTTLDSRNKGMLTTIYEDED